MLRVLLDQPKRGRNRAAYQYFVKYKQLFKLLGIEFVEQGSHDFVFMGDDSYVDRKLSLEDSIDYGINAVNSHNKPVFLFDSSDSTSIMGSYEVFTATNARYLFKNQMASREQYAKPSPFNKWFWNDEKAESNKGYNIPDHEWYKIRLTNWNLGFHNPNNDQFIDGSPTKDVDIFAVMQYEHDENYDWGWRNDLLYTNHRYSSFEHLAVPEFEKYVIEMGTRPQEEYFDLLGRSKVGISPFGMGELCFRDFEFMRFGVPMIKPDMSGIRTEPDFYMENITYIPCKHDWSDLRDVVEMVLSDYDRYKKVAENARLRFRRRYLHSLYTEQWHKLFKNEPGVTMAHLKT